MRVLGDGWCRLYSYLSTIGQIICEFRMENGKKIEQFGTGCLQVDSETGELFVLT